MATTFEAELSASAVRAQPWDWATIASRARRWMPWFVLAAAIASATFVYLRFLPEHRRLWCNFEHDRHAHFYSGLRLADDLRHLRPLQVLSDLDKFRTWPPLHDGLLVGTANLLSGGDPRSAVLPSLLAWIGTALFSFLLARRAVPWGGSIAGLIAALFVLVSPAQRAYATDVMIESTGSCLTIMSLYFYLVAVQEPSTRVGRRLGLSLTLLFLTKYNYWELAVIAIVASLVVTDPFGYLARAKRLVFNESTWSAVKPELLHPLNVPLVGFAIFLGVVAYLGDTKIELFGKTVSLHVSGQLFTVLYWLMFLRLVAWYGSSGRALTARLGDVGRSLVYWHAWPMAVWFLWPDRFYSFAWVSNPNINKGEIPHFDLGGYSFYLSSLTQDYHVAIWSTAAVGVLTAIAMWAGLQRRLRPGAGAILCLVVIAFVLTAHHPNRKSRFLHSWIAAGWATAGIGAAYLLRPRRTHGVAQVARLGFAASVAALGIGHLPALAAPAHAPEGGVIAGRSSVLDVSDAYLPLLSESRRAAIFSNTPLKQFAQWTYLVRYDRDVRLETEIKGFASGADSNRRMFDAWIAATPCDTVVYVGYRSGVPLGPFDLRSSETNGYGELLETQSVFKQVWRREFPELDCFATVWKRTD